MCFNEGEFGSNRSMRPNIPVVILEGHSTTSVQEHLDGRLLGLNPLCDIVHSCVRLWRYLQKGETVFVWLLMAAGLNSKPVSECAARVRMQPADVIYIQMLSRWGFYMCKRKPH